MSEYTSTFGGFQRAMEWSLTGPAEESTAYAEATTLPTFYHVMNGIRLEYNAYISGIAEWRAKISEYKPKVLVRSSFPRSFIVHISRIDGKIIATNSSVMATS
jgi:hypothetical protein